MRNFFRLSIFLSHVFFFVFAQRAWAQKCAEVDLSKGKNGVSICYKDGDTTATVTLYFVKGLAGEVYDGYGMYDIKNGDARVDGGLVKIVKNVHEPGSNIYRFEKVPRYAFKNGKKSRYVFFKPPENEGETPCPPIGGMLGYSINPDKALRISDEVVLESNKNCQAPYNGSANVTVQGGLAALAYSWMDASGAKVSDEEDLQKAKEGQYSFLVTDAYGCSKSTSVTIAAEKVIPPKLTVPVNPIVYCEGDVIQPIIPQGVATGNEVLWYKSAEDGAEPFYTGAEFTPPKPESLDARYEYYVRQKNPATRCESALSDAVVVQVFSRPVLEGVNADQEFCLSDAPSYESLTTETSPNENSVYRWYSTPSGGTALTGAIGPGIKGLYLEEANKPGRGACASVRKQVNVAVYNDPDLNLAFTAGDEHLCEGEGVKLTLKNGEANIEYALFKRGGSTTQPLAVKTSKTAADHEFTVAAADLSLQKNTFYINARRKHSKTGAVLCSNNLVTEPVVTVYAKPRLDLKISAGAEKVCLGEGVDVLVDGSENDTQYSIDGWNTSVPGNGAVLSLRKGSLKFLGVNRIPVFVKNKGCGDSKLMNQLAQAEAVARPQTRTPVLAPKSVCMNGTVQVSLSNPENGMKYILKQIAEDGTAKDLSSKTASGEVQLVFESPEITAVSKFRVVADNGTCEEVMGEDMTVQLKASTNVTLPERVEFCQGESTELNSGIDPSVAGDSFRWEKVEGTKVTVVGTEAVLAVSAAGKYHLVYTNPDGCESVSKETEAVEKERITPVLSVKDNASTTFCRGGSIQLQMDRGASFKWYRGTELLAENTSAVYTVSESGQYNAEIADAGGCYNPSNSITVTVNQAALPDGWNDLIGDQKVCAGANVSSYLPGKAYALYEANTGGTALGGDVPMQEKTYYLQYTDPANSCISERAAVNITFFKAGLLTEASFKFYAPGNQGTDITLCLEDEYVIQVFKPEDGVQYQAVDKDGKVVADSWAKYTNMLVSNRMEATASGVHTYYLRGTKYGCLSYLLDAQGDRKKIVLRVPFSDSKKEIEYSKTPVCDGSQFGFVVKKASKDHEYRVIDKGSGKPVSEYFRLPEGTTEEKDLPYSFNLPKYGITEQAVKKYVVWAKSNEGGCQESEVSEEALSITVNPVLPKLNPPTPQKMASVAGVLPKVSGLDIGDGLKGEAVWRDKDGKVLAPEASLHAKGTETYTLVHRSSEGCESEAASVEVLVGEKPPVPTHPLNPAAAFRYCEAEGKTAADLRKEFIEGTHYKTGAVLHVYLSAAKVTDGTALESGTYEVSQELSGFESDRLSVEVELVQKTIQKPVFEVNASTACQPVASSSFKAAFKGHEESSIKFVLAPANLGTLEATGDAVKISWNWEAIAAQEYASASLTAKASGFCGNEMASDPLTISFNKGLPAVAVDAEQSFCGSKHISDLVYTPSRPLESYEKALWYANATSDSPLAATASLENGASYFVSVKNEGCGSATERKKVKAVVYENRLSLSISEVSLKKMKTELVTLPVVIVDGFDNIRELQFGISYDPALLKLKAEDIETEVPGLTAKVVEAGKIHVKYASAEATGSSLSSNVNLLSLKFALQPLLCGKTEVAFDEQVLASQLEYGEACQSNSFTKKNGSVSLTKELKYELLASAEQVCSGESVDFTLKAENTGANPVYKWYVASAGQENLQNNSTDKFTLPNITKASVVRVEVTPTEACIVDEESDPNKSKRITVGSVSPKVVISAEQTEVCPNETVTFTAKGENADQNPEYFWEVSKDAGASFEKKQEGASNTYDLQAVAGESYQVRVRLKTKQKCSDEPEEGVPSNVLSLKVAQKTMELLALEGPQSICQGSDVALEYTVGVKNADENSLTYKWTVNNGGGIYTTKTLSIKESDLTVPTTAGGNEYEIKVVVSSSDACVSDESKMIEKTLTVTKNAALNFEVSLSVAPENICAGDNATFTAVLKGAGGYPATYKWWVNGAEQTGQTGAAFSSASLSDGDKVKVVATLDLGGKETCYTDKKAQAEHTVKLTAKPVLEFLPVLSGCAPFDLNSVIDREKTDKGTITFYTDAEATKPLANPEAVTVPGAQTFYVKLKRTPEAACGETVKPVTVTVNAMPELSVHDISSAVCGENLDLKKAIDGGFTEKDSFWKDAGATVSVPDPANVSESGTYYVKRNAGVCSVVKPFEATVRKEIKILKVTKKASSSCTAPNGTMNIEVEAGDRDPAQFQYVLEHAASSKQLNQTGNPLFNNLQSGEYQIKVKYPDGCEASKAETLGGPDGVEFSLSADPLTSCGDANGIIEIKITNYDAANRYVYSIDGGNEKEIVSSATEDNLATKSYSVTVKNTASGCEATKTVTVSAADGVKIKSVTPEAEKNCGKNNGKITVAVDGGKAPYVYKLTDKNGKVIQSEEKNNKSHAFLNLTPGDYKVTVIDKGTCEEEETVKVNPADDCNNFDCDKMRAVVSTNAASCAGKEDGTIVVTLRGGVYYEYQVRDSDDN
ncbi:MAG: SprB repeat-containing protein, partial [Cytophagales bacterium]|nr:SprB repeat-containing protein [Cytophagales bacterium]